MSAKELFIRGIKQEWNKAVIRWKAFMKHGFAHTLLLYAAINSLFIIAYVWMEPLLQTSLELKPQYDPDIDVAFLPIALALLPLTLIFEDLGIRMLPWFFIKDVFRLDAIEVEPATAQGDWQIKDKRKWRVWLYHNTRTFYIVVSTLWHIFLHFISNVYGSNLAGSLLYLGVLTFSGYMLARIYIRRGLLATYTVHLSWDALLVGYIVVSSFLSSV